MFKTPVSASAINSVEIAQQPKGPRGLDMVGVVLSSACLIHCTILPVLLALLPFFGTHVHLDERWHFVLTAFIVPVAVLALVSGWLRHHKNSVLIYGSIAMVMILGAPYLHESLGHFGAESLAVLGSGTLIFAHLRNHSYIHHCHTCGH